MLRCLAQGVSRECCHIGNGNGLRAAKRADKLALQDIEVAFSGRALHAMLLALVKFGGYGSAR